MIGFSCIFTANRKVRTKRKFQNTRFTESNLHCQPSSMSHCHCVHQTRCRAAETLVQSQHCTHYQSQSMWIDLPQLEPLLKLVVEWLHRQKFEINELTTLILLLHGEYFSACFFWSPFLSCICLALIMTLCTGYHACTKLYEALYSILLNYLKQVAKNDLGMRLLPHYVANNLSTINLWHNLPMHSVTSWFGANPFGHCTGSVFWWKKMPNA